MSTPPAPSRMRRTVTILGLVTASLVCLFAGAQLAVAYEGSMRLLFAGAGFCGYLFFFARALRTVGAPFAISGWAPDGEVQRAPVRRGAREAERNRGLTAAA